MSGGVKIAEKIKIPIIKYFLYFLRLSIFKILIFVRIISKIGNKNDIPLANNRYIVSFIYSEYLDSNSTLKEFPTKFSKDKKKFHITGIRK